MTEKFDISEANLDTSIRPVDNFYDYANGGWQKNNPLPPEKARYGVFDALGEDNRKKLRSLIEGLSESPDSKIAGTPAQKVADLYAQGLDIETRNVQGIAPVKPQLERINGTPQEHCPELMAWLHSGISSSFFSTGVGPDPHDSGMNILHVGEGGLTLGDRDYYLVESEDNRRILEAFKVYVTRILSLAGYGDEDALRAWNNIIEIETKLAAFKKTREMRRDPTLSDNPTTLEDFLNEYSSEILDWERYFKSLNLPPFTTLNISSPSYLKGLIGLLPTLTWQAVTDYLSFHAIDAVTSLLTQDFFDASFQFYDVVMSGVEEPEPLWKRAMAIPSSMLGQAIGQLYVKQYFPESHKEKALSLVENLRKSFHIHIDSLQWMSADTKKKAHAKLDAMGLKIGYPDKWKDYTTLLIDPQAYYLDNVLNASRWYVRDNYDRLGKPVDKTEWHMFPQTVNAYYSPVNNEICFPAAILQPPFFHPEAPAAVNYGAIGVVIAHEMTHGFDDQGRRFDSDGNLTDWWTEDDALHFSKLTEGLVRQFDAIEVLPGIHANGTYTLGENIADQGGLRLALTALQSLQPGSVIPKQELHKFFLSYAHVWADNIRDEEIKSRTMSDPHSLGRWRVNATLRNLEEFHHTFDTTPEDPMYLAEDDRTVIW